MGAKSCSTHTITTRIDTLTYERPVEVVKTKTRTIYRYNGTDTVYVVADSIASDSSMNGARFTAISDTMTMQDKARIAATYNYPESTFDLYYKPHPDTVFVRHEQDENSILKGWSFGVGVGYGVAEVDGVARVKPYVGVNLQKTLIGW